MIENTFRLIIVGVSIAFFQQIAFSEFIQMIYSLFCVLYNYGAIGVQKLTQTIGSSSRRTKKQLTNKEVCK